MEEVGKEDTRDLAQAVQWGEEGPVVRGGRQGEQKRRLHSIHSFIQQSFIECLLCGSTVMRKMNYVTQDGKL